MIFHTKCGILLILCTIGYTVKQCVAEDISMIFQNEDTDEENAIKEALLLVELLKNVQDKTMLRNIDTTVEDSTCAATTLEGLSTPVLNETSSAIITEANMVTTPEANMVTKTEASMVTTTEASVVTTTEASMVTTTEANMVRTPNIQFPQYRRAFMPNWPRMPSPHDKQHHHHPRISPDEQQADYYGPRGFFRRRFPDYFYFQNYFDFPRGNKGKPIPGFRRVQYDEIQTSSASPVSVKTTTTTVSPLTRTTKSMKKATQMRARKSKPIQKKPVATIENKRVILKKFKPRFKKNRRQLGDETPSNTTESTLGSQKIATTMESLNANVEQNMTTKGQGSTKDSLKDEIAWELNKELNGSKIVDKALNKGSTGKFRTTLRIYLDGSTRYHIPFPENHAFCFTNPESWLCRTP